MGERTNELRRLIDAYKFENARAAYAPLAELLVHQAEQLPANTIVVPVPTVVSHIRMRGYDHADLLARTFARKRKLAHRRLITRTTSTKQRDASRSVRVSQAKKAFVVNKKLDPSIPYLLIDDVITTGATLHYAAKALKAAGARTVWTAVIARQPLD